MASVKNVPVAAPDEGAVPVLGPEAVSLLEQVGELIVDGRLYTHVPSEFLGAAVPDEVKESGDVG